MDGIWSMAFLAWFQELRFCPRGILSLQVSEAEVNNIYLCFLSKTGEPTTGKTRPETILRQLNTKKGQVYNMLQAKRDVDTLLAMGIMKDISIVPKPAGVAPQPKGDRVKVGF